MSRGRTTVLGLGKLRRNLSRAASRLRESAEEAVAQEVEATKDDARRLAPKDTGKLRRGIRPDVDGTQGTVKSTVRYATFVEFGTKNTKAQPYMTPAAALSRGRLPKRAATAIRKALERR